MNILVIGTFQIDVFAKRILVSLIDLGHDVITFLINLNLIMTETRIVNRFVQEIHIIYNIYNECRN